jgi:hypothetical protein
MLHPEWEHVNTVSSDEYPLGWSRRAEKAQKRENCELMYNGIPLHHHPKGYS